MRGYVLAVPPGEELARAAALAQDPAVVYAEPNWLVRAADAGSEALVAETPVRINDPLYRARQWYLPRIHAARAWALSGAVAAQAVEAERISVVIVDSGVDSTHPDLGRLTLTGRNYLTPRCRRMTTMAMARTWPA